MRFVLFGGGEAGRLAAGHLSRVLSRGAFAGIVWDAKLGAAPDVAESLTEAECRELGAPDCVLLCSGYGHILGAETIGSFGGGAFNAHPSILPAYRGRHAIQWAIAQGETLFGVTVHRLSEGIDCGDYVMMRSARYGLDVDYPEISQGLSAMAADMLADLALRLAAGEALPVLPQDPRVDRYFRRRTPEDGRIVWREASAAAIGRVRAGTPAYPAYAKRSNGGVVTFNGKLVGRIPGEVLMSTNEGALIATGDGVVWLKTDQALTAGEILG